MNAAPFILWLLAAVLGVVALARGDGRHRKAIEYAIGQFVILFPRMILAMTSVWKSFFMIFLPFPRPLIFRSMDKDTLPNHGCPLKDQSRVRIRCLVLILNR